jgi:hypothetical protein
MFSPLQFFMGGDDYIFCREMDVFGTLLYFIIPNW